MVDRRELGAIFLGGALGTLLRAGLLEGLGEGAPGWPWATFAVNLFGAFLLGFLVVRFSPAFRWRPLLTTGLCGGLTTFSTMQVELLTMLEAGRPGIAAGYAAASVVGGLLGVAAGGAVAPIPAEAR
jgi:fluoride exporter